MRVMDGVFMVFSQVVQQSAGMPEGLRLAVPQSVMAACYPPRASYKMHLDSYFRQGLVLQMATA